MSKSKGKTKGVTYVGREDFGVAKAGGVNLGKKYNPEEEVVGMNVFVLQEDCPHWEEEGVQVDDRDHPEEVRCFCMFITDDAPHRERPGHWVCPYYPLCYAKAGK